MTLHRHAAGGQRHPAGQGPDDAQRNGGRCDADLGTEFDQERGRRTGSRDASDPEGGTAANVNDLNVAGELLHGLETAAFGDAGYQGVHKRDEAQGPTWFVAMKPSLRRRLNPIIEPEYVAEQAERAKASIRAQVEHPFRVLKRQFGYAKVRYRGLRKNTAQIVTLFALSNLWMARRRLLQAVR